MILFGGTLGYPIDKVKGTKGLFEMTQLKSNRIIVYMAVCASILSHYDLLDSRILLQNTPGRAMNFSSFS